MKEETHLLVNKTEEEPKNVCICKKSNWDSLACPIHGLGTITTEKSS